MPRPPRLNPIDGIHHVTNHRAGDEDLFLTHRDFLLLLRLVQLASEETGVVVIEYCLMPNHYHLVVRCPEGSLDRFIHYVQGNYARAFNHRHGNKGPVFQRRYHNVLITSDEQFHLTCRYVNRNPAELGYDIASYPWSSFALHKQPTAAAHDVVAVDQTMLLGMFGSHPAYVAFVERPMPHDKFALVGKHRTMDLDQSTVADELTGLCEIITDVTGADLETIRSSARGRRNNARLVATLLASELFPADTDAICKTLGYRSTGTFRSALNRARRFYEEDDQIRTNVDLARNAWATSEHRAA